MMLPSFLLAGALLFQGSTAEPLSPHRFCTVPPASKQDCGFMGVNASTCEAKGCCWQPLSAHSAEPWCYHPSNPAQKILEGFVEGFLADEASVKGCIGGPSGVLGDVEGALREISKRDMRDVASGLRKLADALDAIPIALTECKASASDVKSIMAILEAFKGFGDLAKHVFDDVNANLDTIWADMKDTATACAAHQYEVCGSKLGVTLRWIIVGKQAAADASNPAKQHKQIIV